MNHHLEVSAMRFHSSLPVLPKLIKSPTANPVAFK
jgi:hypothetical protein